MMIFTAVHGDEYIGYFERGLLRSLTWPKNLEAMKTAHWVIATQNESERARLDKLVAGVARQVTHIVGGDLWTVVKKGARMSQEANEIFVLAPPDNCFSEGSLPNFLQIAAQPKTCVATAHVRVLPTFLDGLSDPLEAPRMVNRAWKNLHGSWTQSEARDGMSSTYEGGVFFQRLGDRVVAVQHRLPTVFAANMLREDIEYFNGQPVFGIWDNCWPPDKLISQQRYRYLGSSDAGFVVEITHPGRNVPALHPQDPNEPDKFKGNSLHNWMNREFVAIIRGEEAL